MGGWSNDNRDTIEWDGSIKVKNKFIGDGSQLTNLPIDFGAAYEIPTTNTTSDNFIYSSKFTHDGDGGISIGGLSLNNSEALKIYKLQTALSGNSYGINVAPTAQPASNSTGIFTGARTSITAEGSSTITRLTGGYFQVYNNNSATSGNGLAQAFGGHFIITNASTGKINSMVCGRFGVENLSTGLVNNTYGCGIFRPVGTAGGTYVNMYGLYMEDQTPTAGSMSNTPYAIYQAGTTNKNYFGGLIGIGTTNPSEVLDVIGDIEVSADIHNLADNGKHYFGASDDASIYYDGTDLILNGKEVGTGGVRPISRLIVPMGEISYFDTTGTTISIASTSDGSTNMVVVNPTTALSTSYEFDNGGSNNGRLRYTGTTTKMFHIACTISIASTAANDLFVFGVAKNGSVVAASKVLMKVIGAADTQSTALHLMVEMATNDYLELYVGNTTDTDDLVVKTLNLFAMGM
jgi:hypothetical protein